MCSRARLRNVSMSERKPPAGVEGVCGISLLRLGGGTRVRTARGGLAFLHRRLGLLVLRLGVLLAGVLLLALHVVAALLRHLVLRGGLGFLDLALVAWRGVLLRVELRLGDLLLALRFLLTDVLRVAAHRVALGLFGLVLGFDAILFRVLHLAVSARGWGLGLSLCNTRQRERGGNADDFEFHELSSPIGLRPTQQAGDQRNEKQHDEYDEQNLRDLRRTRGNSGEAEDGRDDGYDEKRKRPAEHD